MKFFFTFCFLTFVNWHACYSQFIEDFNDTDFIINPMWSGDQSKFIVEAGLLKLSAPALASSAYLSTPSQAINKASWEFFIQMNFNPSSTNLARIYLVSDQANLSGSLNGYFIKAGNTDDEISLYRQDGTTEVKIIDGINKSLNTTNAKAKIKVLRDDSGSWQLFSDVGVTGIYLQEGIVTDNTYLETSFFGVHCRYTTTRSDKFYFDDFVVTGDPFADAIAPALESITIVSSNKLHLKFSENVDQSAGETTHYFASNGLGAPAAAEILADQRAVEISFAQDFPNGIQCTLATSGVKDVAGNIMALTETVFTFFKPGLVLNKDIIITEIFTDPNPQIGLPDVEYVELFNRSKNPIDLRDWEFSDGSSTGFFSSLILSPGEYLIVSPATTVMQYNSFGRTAGLTNFPTLNNAGDALTIKDSDGIIIDSVNYSYTWYKDVDKSQGGWSLELIDPGNVCSEIDNWIASEDLSGGTPGKQNSTFADKPDLMGTKLISAIPNSENFITLTFNEKLEKTFSNGIFKIDPPIEIASAVLIDPSLTKIGLTLVENLKPEILYGITVESIYDCAGNIIQKEFNKIEFGLPERADSLDIVINEILFNPRPTGVDLVEMYNRSTKFINLKDFSIANIETGLIGNAKVIITTDFLMKPTSYLVLTEDGNILKGEYINSRENNFFQVEALPAFNDDEGSVALIDDEGKVLDDFYYTKEMHSVFVKNEEGVSLERIAFDKSTNDGQNWKSASSTEGFATPGYENSNSRANPQLSDESVKVDPEIFIPVSGSLDFAQINYNFDQGGYMANVKIYDTQGRQIKQLTNNALLGANGFFRWDGDKDDGGKARVGYYVINFEIIKSNGTVKTFRKRVVIATTF